MTSARAPLGCSWGAYWKWRNHPLTGMHTSVRSLSALVVSRSLNFSFLTPLPRRRSPPGNLCPPRPSRRAAMAPTVALVQAQCPAPDIAEFPPSTFRRPWLWPWDLVPLIPYVISEPATGGTMKRNFTCPGTGEACTDGRCKRGIICCEQERDKAISAAADGRARQTRIRHRRPTLDDLGL